MSMDYETFRTHMDRYEREKADREDAEKWRTSQSERDQKPDPKPEKKEPDPHVHKGPA